MILIFGAVLGFIAIAFGAYAEHGLRSGLSDEMFRSVMTAIRYNQIHAVVIVAIGLALLQPAIVQGNTALTWTAWLFVIGTVLFSFSIYLSAVLGIPSLIKVTPVGGIVLMAAWLGLAWTGYKSLTG